MAGKSERKAAASAVADKSERKAGGDLSENERVITLMKAIKNAFADEGDDDYDDDDDDDDDAD